MKLMSVALSLLLLPSLAAAQGSGVFIEAGPLLNIASATEFTTSYPGVSMSVPITGGITFAGIVPGDLRSESSSDRMSAGGTLSLGVFVAPSVSLRVEGSFQGAFRRDERVSSALSRTLNTSQNTTHSTDITVAAALHQGAHRTVGINYLAGMVFRRYHTDESYFSSYEQASTSVVNGRLVQTSETMVDEYTVSATGYGAGIMAGLDVPWRISHTVAIVPQFRMVIALGELAIRPAITLRWNP